MFAWNKFFMQIPLLLLFAACSGKTPSDLLGGGEDSGELASSGVIAVVRGDNGNVRIDFRGMTGSDQYVLVEQAYPTTIADADLLKSTATREKQIQVIKHSPGQASYSFSTSNIPFGAKFCYRIDSTVAGGAAQRTLPRKLCLTNDDSWLFQGTKTVSSDDLGRVVIRWTQLPARGTSYDIYRHTGTTTTFSDTPYTTVNDAGSYVEELVGNGIFPRCYKVVARQQLFSDPDLNVREVCIDHTRYLSERNSNDDTQPPVFAGLKTLNAVPNSSALGQVGQAVGLNGKFKAVLAWDAATDNVSRTPDLVYRVYRTDKMWQFDFTKPLATTSPGVTNYTDNTLADGKIYYYVVRAVDERGNEDSNFTQVDLPIDIHAPNFAGLNDKIGFRLDNNMPVALLSWPQANDDKTQAGGILYRIYRVEQPAAMVYSNPVAEIQGVTSYEDKTVVSGKLYSYAVHAVDGGMNEDANAVVRGFNAGQTPPIFAGITGASLQGLVVALQWQSATDSETSVANIRYRVYRRDADAIPTSTYDFQHPLMETAGGVVKVNDESVNTNKSWAYCVRAVNDRNFESTNTQEFLVNANGRPYMTGSVAVTWDKDLQGAKLTWAPALDDRTSPTNMYYQIFRSQQGTLNSFDFTKPLDSTQKGVKSYTDTTVLPTQTYYYVVLPVDESGAVGDPASQNPPAMLTLNQPPLANGINSITEVSNPRGIQLVWSQGTDDRTKSENLTYNVYRFENISGQPNPTRSFSSTLVKLGQNALIYTDTSVDWSKDYSYVVRAVDDAGLESTNASESNLGTNFPPQFLGLTSLEIVNQSMVTLHWNEATDDRTPKEKMTYKIYKYRVPAGTTATADQVFMNDNVALSIQGSVTLQNMAIDDPSQSYYFGVRAFDEAGQRDTLGTNTAPVPGNAPPTFTGLWSAAYDVPSRSTQLAWNSAADDRDAATTIRYAIYKLADSSQSASASAVACSSCLLKITAGGNLSASDNAVDSSKYTHYLVRALDSLNAADTNEVVKTIAPDTVNPGFGGISSAQMNGTCIVLNWNAAVDDRTPSMNIMYKIYEVNSVLYNATSNGGITALLASTPVTTVTGGVTTATRCPDTGNSTFYYVVRAFDEAGNQDTNQVVKYTQDVVPPIFAGLVSGYAVSDTSVQLFWDTTVNEDIKEFRIYDTSNTSVPLAKLQTRDGSGKWLTSYIVSGLQAARQYSFVVRAADSSGNEDTNTKYQVVTTLAESSPSFAGLQFASALPGVDGLTQIQLRWNAAANATHYQIFRVPGVSLRGVEFDFNYNTCQLNWSDATKPGCIEIVASGETYTVAALSQNTVYSFVVRAVRKSGSNVVAGEYNRTILSTSTNPMQAPTFAGLDTANPATGNEGLTSVVVTWSDPSSDGVFDSFVVYYLQMAIGSSATTFNLSDSSVQQSAVFQGTVRSATITSLTTSKRYCFVAVAKYQAQSLSSVPTTAGFKCATPVAVPPTFGGVSTLVPGAESSAFHQFAVNWAAASGSFSRYEISWATANTWTSDIDPGVFFQSGNTIKIPGDRAGDITTTQTTLSSLMANKTYFVRVRAVFDTGSGTVLYAGSSVVANVVTAPKEPGGDGLFSAVLQADSSVKLTWIPPSNGGGFNRYYIFRAKGSTAATDVVTNAGLNATQSPPYNSVFRTVTVSDTTPNYVEDRDTLVSGDYVCYLVRAAFIEPTGVPPLGFVGSSNSVTKCVNIVIPPPVFSGLDSINTINAESGFTSLQLNWTPATGNFTRYEVAYDTTASPSNWTTISGVSQASTGAILTGLTPNTSYNIRVRAVYDPGVAGGPFVSGDQTIRSGVTTPLKPVNSGLILTPGNSVGEVTLSWALPNSNPNVGGLYNMILLWKWTDGSEALITNEIATLMQDSVITTTEIASSSNHVEQLASNATTRSYLSTNALPANHTTCFLVRAAFRNTSQSLFLLSDDTTFKCFTPTLQAPIFAGIRELDNIPDQTNGFSQIIAKWDAAMGSFTRYDVLLSESSDVTSTSWSVLAGQSATIGTTQMTLSSTNMANAAGTKIVPNRTYYARVRAVVTQNANVYTSGEGLVASQVLRPNLPTGDDIISVVPTKVAGQPTQATVTFPGNFSGFWNKVSVFRYTNLDQSTARAGAISASTVKADFTGFVGTPIGTVANPGNAPAQMTYVDTNATMGSWNCYIVRGTYQDTSYFLASTDAKTPVCVNPVYNPIFFTGLANTGSGICDDTGCNASLVWPNTGNSKIRLKFSSVPQGDIDYYDVYMSKMSDSATLLSGTPFQRILKGDSIHDPVPNDLYLYVGGLDTLRIPQGTYYFVVRAGCIGCPFVDTNTAVSNSVTTLPPSLATNYSFSQSNTTLNYVENVYGGGRFTDVLNKAVFATAPGLATLGSVDDYLRASRPGQFVPAPNKSFMLKFSVASDSSGLQNATGSGVFALDTGARTAYWNGWDNFPVSASTFGVANGVSVFDEANRQCLWMGAENRSGANAWDYNIGWINNPSWQYRMNAWDGQNLSDVYPEGTTPLPRFFPELVFNPSTQRVMLYGGIQNDVVMSDTWEYDGKTWTQLFGNRPTTQANVSEPGRYGSQALAWDPFNNKMMMFGGRYMLPNVSWTSVRTNSIWHFDPTAGWTKDAYTIPAALPTYAGFNSSLVTVPSGPYKGVYYFAISNNSGSDWVNTNVWKWDGSTFSAFANSAMPYSTARAVSNLYVWWDDSRQRFGVSIGYWESQFKRIFEWSPANPTTWTVQSPGVQPQAMMNTYPCFDNYRRELVDYDGRAVSGVSGAPNREQSDIWIWSNSLTQWRQVPLNYEPNFYGMMMPLFGSNKVWAIGTNNYQYTFAAGSWKKTLLNLPTDINLSSNRVPFNFNYVSNLTTDVSTGVRQPPLTNLKSLPSSVPASNDPDAYATASGELADRMYVLQNSDRFDNTAAIGRGRLNALSLYDPSQGWLNYPLSSSDIWVPQQDVCSNANASEQRPYLGTWWNNGRHVWSSVRVPWKGGAILAKAALFAGNIPYDMLNPDPNMCNSARTWRTAYNPRFSMVVADGSGGYKAREIKIPSVDADAASGWELCSANDANPGGVNAFLPIFQYHHAVMAYDPSHDRVVVYGYKDASNNWTYFSSKIQYITYDLTNRCFLITNATAGPASSGLNSAEGIAAPAWRGSSTNVNVDGSSMSYSWMEFYDTDAVTDTNRNVVMYPTNYWSYGYASTIGLYEFNLANLTWVRRDVPSKYQKYSVLTGNYNQVITPLPGVPGTFLLKPLQEIQTNRALSESYYLRLPDPTKALVVEPTPPAFGLTLGDDGQTGYLSVPGDVGENFAGTTVASGRRTVGNVSGSHSFVVVFETATYDAYLDGTKVINQASWSGSGSVYGGEFILGARYGYYGMYRDINQRNYRGYGNTNSSFQSLRTFDKALTSSEITYWLSK